MNKYVLSTILIVLVAFSLGAGGGIWAQAFLLPALAANPAFAEWQFIQDWRNRTTVIRQVQEITLSQEEAFVRAAERTRNVSVAIQSSSNAQASSGSGLVVTSDGVILTLASVVPQEVPAFVVFNQNQEAVPAQVLRRDAQNNLALLKVDRGGLPTAGFGTTSDAKPGKELLLLAKTVEGGELLLLTNQGSVRSAGLEEVRTNIFEKTSLRGSPLIDTEGRVLGIAQIESNGRVVAIPASLLREFSGL